MIDVHSPYNGTHVGQVQSATAEDVERAIAAAYGLYRDRRQWLSKQQRLSILKRAAEIVADRREEIARQASNEGGGKPLKDSIIEVKRGIDGINICMEELRTNAGRVVPMDLNATSTGQVAFTQYEPPGVVTGSARGPQSGRPPPTTFSLKQSDKKLRRPAVSGRNLTNKADSKLVFAEKSQPEPQSTVVSLESSRSAGLSKVRFIWF